MKIIIAGAGSVGRYLVERLVAEEHDIVLIDQSESILEEIASIFDIQTLLGSASSLENLEKAGIAGADIFIAATDSDETNLITCLLADSIDQDVRKIARIRELVTDESGLSSRIADVFTHFINPDSESVLSFLRSIDVPGAAEVMEFGGGKIWVVGVYPEADSRIVGAQLKELPQLVTTDEMVVAAIARNGHLIIPSGEDRVVAGDELYVAVRAGHLSPFLSLLGKKQKSVKYVMIYGGGRVGRSLAKQLVERDIKVKLIESDPDLCEELACELKNVLVLQGEPTDRELLTEEGVANIDMFIGASFDEEKNVLAALLAKRLGAKRGAVIVTNPSYVNLIPELGVDVVVSPHIAAGSTILRYLRSSSTSSVFSIKDESAEVLEIEALEGSDIVNTPIKELSLPTGVIIAAMHKEEVVTIPRGDTVIEPGTRVIFFASRKALPKLQKLVDA